MRSIITVRSLAGGVRSLVPTVVTKQRLTSGPNVLLALGLFSSLGLRFVHRKG